MRRPLALLALAATSWSHVAALHCEIGPHATRAGDAAHAHGAPAAPHAPPAAGHQHGSEAHSSGPDAGQHRALAHQHGSPGGDVDCRSVSTCGTLMIGVAAGGQRIRLPAPSLPAAPVLAAARSAARLGADPPPPRPFV